MAAWFSRCGKDLATREAYDTVGGVGGFGIHFVPIPARACAATGEWRSMPAFWNWGFCLDWHMPSSQLDLVATRSSKGSGYMGLIVGCKGCNVRVLCFGFVCAGRLVLLYHACFFFLAWHQLDLGCDSCKAPLHEY